MSISDGFVDRKRMQVHRVDGSDSDPTASKGFNHGASGAISGEVTGIVPSTHAGVTPQQQSLLDAALKGLSFFYTGSAGTGKSYVLRAMIDALHSKHSKGDGSVAVTATTGSAAYHIGGVTVHSWAGVGFAEESQTVLARKVANTPSAAARWRKVRVLVIDEVSMLDAGLFDKLAFVASAVTGVSAPFGGIQVIATGDFFQLPPVERLGLARFAFEAQLWSKVFPHVFVLRTVFRQPDTDLSAMLNEIRMGIVSDSTLECFTSLARPLRFSDGPEPTQLFPVRRDVDLANLCRLRQLKSPLHDFIARDVGYANDTGRRDRLLAGVAAPKLISLRVGAQVMLIRNINVSLVNGSVGRVVGFVDSELYDENGQIIPYDRESANSAEKAVYPVILFGMCDGGRELVVRPESFTVRKPSGEVLVSRTQLPLILAWALSIHKAQGKSLDRMSVDLKKIFERGQVYVALSRAVSLDGLQVLNFSRGKVRAHPKVVAWSLRLDSGL